MLFTYGTLMRGYGLHRLLATGAKLLGAGSVRGTLLDLGDFPGLVDGAGRVVGEVYRLDAPELLAVLDRAEGYNFVRRRATVTLAPGRRARNCTPRRVRAQRERSEEHAPELRPLRQIVGRVLLAYIE